MDLSVISTDRLILRFVEIELQRRRRLNCFTKDFFTGCYFPLVYQARSSLPTNFDCDLAYTLGWGAAALVSLGKTGQLVHASGLELPVDEWRIAGIPLTSLVSIEYDEETQQHLISPAHVKLLKQRGIDRPFKRWLPRVCDRSTVFHGPTQFWGPASSHPSLRTTWYLQNMPLQDPTEHLNGIVKLCSELQSIMVQSRVESTLCAATAILGHAFEVLSSCKSLEQAQRKTTATLADVPVEGPQQVYRTKRASASSGD